MCLIITKSESLSNFSSKIKNSRSINDRIGEAKASGNLGNTLKMMNQYDSAVSYCKKHLDIARELNDKVSEIFLINFCLF
mgnify:FL=1